MQGGRRGGGAAYAHPSTPPSRPTGPRLVADRTWVQPIGRHAGTFPGRGSIRVAAKKKTGPVEFPLTKNEIRGILGCPNKTGNSASSGIRPEASLRGPSHVHEEGPMKRIVRVGSALLFLVATMAVE